MLLGYATGRVGLLASRPARPGTTADCSPMKFLLIGYEFAKFVVKALGILIGIGPG